MDLNLEQQKAVRMHKGRVCVIAGAGSGKTRVLVERIAAMIEDGIRPEQILAFTFTKKAATEMQERLQHAIGHVVEDVTVGTIHSVFWHILKEHIDEVDPAYKYGCAILHQWQARKFIKEAHTENYLNDEDEPLCKGVIGRAKNSMIHAGNEFDSWLENQNYPDSQIEYYGLVYREYEKKKRKERLIDFDDMLIMTYDLFRRHPQRLAEAQTKWDYVSVDEYQDINPVQEAIIEMLTAEHGNLFVVGDARQSIYGFRASEPSYILDFEDKHPDAQVVSLDKNYRCGSNILDHANQLIALNDEGTEPLTSETGFLGEVKVMDAHNTNEDEAEAIATNCANYTGEWEDIAVLYRTNAQSRALEDAMIKKTIPYEIIGSEGFYGRQEIRDIIAYMEVATTMDKLRDFSHFERLINKPTRYLGKKFIAEWHPKAKELGPIECLSGHFSSVNRRSLPSVHKLKEDLEALEELVPDPTSFMSYIRQDMGYDKWLIDNRSDTGEEDFEILSNLSEMSCAAANFNTIQTMLNYIHDVIRRSEEKEGGNKVKLMSLHRAKGLEFPVVFIAGLCDVLLPHSKCDDVTEERRLMYVGVTRAKQTLTLSHYTEHRNQIVGPSQFFSEMGIAVAEPEDQGDHDDEVEYEH